MTPLASVPAPDSAAARTSGGLRIVTFNMWSGQQAGGWQDAQSCLGPIDVPGRQVLARQALDAAIVQLRRINPDVVLLQEVDKGQRRSGYLPQALLLAQGLGLPYCRLGASFSGAFIGIHRRPLRSTIPNVAGFGVAVLSRYPVSSWHFKRLGRARPTIKWAGTRWEGTQMGLLAGLRQLPRALHGLRLNVGQQRVLLAGQIVTPAGTIAVGCTHLETQTATAAGQTRRAWRAVHGLCPDSCLLAGDFNLSPAQVTEALSIFGEQYRPAAQFSAPSFPANRPQHSIDQFLTTGWQLAPGTQVRSERLPISDHLALVIDVLPS